MQMRSLCSKGRYAVAALLLGMVMLVAGPVSAQEAELMNSDCVKCHQAVPQQIEEKGMAHKTAVSCLDCHVGHPPEVADNIPACAMCHAGTPHYDEIENCAQCHVNPHTPLELTLDGELKAECLTCHDPIGQQLTANPSAHTEVSCNFCHADTHGYIPECMVCHETHSEEIAAQDCAACHQAHMPLEVAYDDQLPSVFCAACHDTAYKELNATPTKHQTLACVYCHQDEHKMVPLCSDCHGVPHAPGIHEKFPTCGECHNTAHDLNNWPGQAK
jgi:hypothetical protein